MPVMPHKTKPLHCAIAVLASDLVAGDGVPVDFRLIPAGAFKPVDGRKLDCGAWVCTDEDGRRLVAEANARISPRVIDYEHATLKAKADRTQAPAAGWFNKLEWRPGDGLWVIGADWTALAAQQIADKQYRFISPVFSYDPKTGRVGRLLFAALTNDPGLDGLTDLAALAAELMGDVDISPDLLPSPEIPPPKESYMDLLNKLLAALGLQENASEEAALSAVAALKTNVAALTSQVGNPDPAKFVPVATFTEVQSALAALTAQVNQDKVDALVNEGLASGKLLPASESWARDLGANNVAALSAYLEVAPVVVAPGVTQTGGAAPSGNGSQLTASQLAVCSATGVSPADFLATLQAEAGQVAA